MSEIKLQGADALVKSISNRVGRDEINKAIKKRASDGQTKAQREAAVDTGAMKRSITVDLWPGRLTGSVVVGSEYAPYVEYGTRFAPEQPFMRPARDEIYPMFINDLRNLIK
ncbi:HK97-gp10 family putative phage morphogenesis protein [Salinicoccus albus]|uniref:HK97-gp10 family putative phage morphogenesis protein n=1 Tax=Salinicoccus albus TaxID=418756 RepID=UPI00036CA88E|nr:HK97-gp10 family putative phage morphogenesis protein [Salinicoccus albus]